MSTDDDGIIDAEIVEDNRLPARLDAQGTHEGAKAVKAQTREDGRDWPHGPLPERRCRAHSSRTGEPSRTRPSKEAPSVDSTAERRSRLKPMPELGWKTPPTSWPNSYLGLRSRLIVSQSNSRPSVTP